MLLLYEQVCNTATNNHKRVRNNLPSGAVRIKKSIMPTNPQMIDIVQVIELLFVMSGEKQKLLLEH